MWAYKFLRTGAVGPFSGFRWPIPQNGSPGPWVEADGQLEPCLRGVHACRADQLPPWIFDELWEIELDGELVELEDVLVARRGRLVRRSEHWNPELRLAFSRACAARVREAAKASGESRVHANAADAERSAESGRTAEGACVTAYIAATAAEAASGGGGQAERRQQARWLEERLGL